MGQKLDQSSIPAAFAEYVSARMRTIDQDRVIDKQTSVQLPRDFDAMDDAIDVIARSPASDLHDIEIKLWMALIMRLSRIDEELYGIKRDIEYFELNCENFDIDINLLVSSIASLRIEAERSFPGPAS